LDEKNAIRRASATAESTNHLHGDREEEKDGIFFFAI
jgi:hypothetical protein